VLSTLLGREVHRRHEHAGVADVLELEALLGHRLGFVRPQGRDDRRGRRHGGAQEVDALRELLAGGEEAVPVGRERADDQTAGSSVGGAPVPEDVLPAQAQGFHADRGEELLPLGVLGTEHPEREPEVLDHGLTLEGVGAGHPLSADHLEAGTRDAAAPTGPLRGGDRLEGELFDALGLLEQRAGADRRLLRDVEGQRAAGLVLHGTDVLELSLLPGGDGAGGVASPSRLGLVGDALLEPMLYVQGEALRGRENAVRPGTRVVHHVLHRGVLDARDVHRGSELVRDGDVDEATTDGCRRHATAGDVDADVLEVPAEQPTKQVDVLARDAARAESRPGSPEDLSELFCQNRRLILPEDDASFGRARIEELLGLDGVHQRRILSIAPPRSWNILRTLQCTSSPSWRPATWRRRTFSNPAASSSE
jgi:hypothetical protein